MKRATPPNLESMQGPLADTIARSFARPHARAQPCTHSITRDHGRSTCARARTHTDTIRARAHTHTLPLSLCTHSLANMAGPLADIVDKSDLVPGVYEGGFKVSIIMLVFSFFRAVSR